MASRVKKEFAQRTRRVAAGIFLVLLLASPALLHSQPLLVPQGTKCVECGMTVDQNSRFMSEVITKDSKKLFFCDIGDMLFHFRSDREKFKDVHVKDYGTGEWIDGKKAFYVLNKKISTPMSWGIAAFSAESAAKTWGEAADFNGAFKLLR